MKYTLNEFCQKELSDCFEKIKIVDDSIDLKVMRRQVLEYYTNLFQRKSDPKQNKSFDFIDLFSGAGGLSTGLEECGLRSVLAVDNYETALRTYRFNRPDMDPNAIINEDIRDLVKNYTFPQAPVVVGGPPCQGFSEANRQRKAFDERNILYKFYVNTVDQVRPQIFLIENVEGILKVIDEIRQNFKKIGYHIFKPVLLNTSDFGFPQNRRRAFILGCSNEYLAIEHDISTIYTETIQSEKGKYCFALMDAIGDLPKLEAKTQVHATYDECQRWGYTFAGFHELTTPYTRLINVGSGKTVPILNHKAKYNNSRDIEIFRTLQPGENSNAESIRELNPYANRNDIFKDKYFKLQPDQPCKTITAHMYYDCNMYIHPYSARGLTPREAARIQGFPDNYFFLGTPNEWYRQIGNAVSPLLARVMGMALYNILLRINR